jgi:purine-binding chemotaxis protein CheW
MPWRKKHDFFIPHSVLRIPNLQKEAAMSTMELTGTTQYLTYKLADEVFAFDISKVREVLDFTTITKVPKMPAFLRGVINLRGTVVPVVDLRIKFGMPKTDKTVDTCIIITEVNVDGVQTTLGALADSVQEVMDLGPDSIEPAPKIGTGLNTEFIKGMGKHNERFVIILDIDKVFSADELAAVQAERSAALTEAA